MLATVVFTNEVDHWLAKTLRPGFRHVFCAVDHPEHPQAVVYNLTDRGLLSVASSVYGKALALHYRNAGLIALSVPATPWNRPRGPFTINSCVGLTKQVIGIESFALTPYQLYRHLMKEHPSCASSFD